MPNLTAQLRKDGHLLNRPTPKAKQKKQLKKVSKRREGANREYTLRRKAFLWEHPYCFAYGIIAAAWRLGEGQAIPAHWPKSCPRSEEIHHMRKPKCKYLNDESTWLAVSRWSHEWIESHKSTARKLGLLF